MATEKNSSNIKNNYNIDGKKILITGASRGIGAETVKYLVQNKAIVTVSSSNINSLEKLKENFTIDEQRYIFTIACDLSNHEERNTLVSKSIEIMGGMDGLVCNAGITKDTLSIKMKDDMWENVLDVNLAASFRLNADAIKFMIKQRHGSIVNISSIVGFTGNAGQANYSASKAGLIGMTKSLALETASRGVRVNAIAPGFIKTDMTDKLTEEQMAIIVSKIPLGRQGSTSDIANGILFLLSEASNYITGTTLHINGGMLMN